MEKVRFDDGAGSARRPHCLTCSATSSGSSATAGIPVSMSEHVDAARAVEVIDLGDRYMLRNTLAATLVKDGDHLPVFNSAFEVYFSIRSWTRGDPSLDDGSCRRRRCSRRRALVRKDETPGRGRRRVGLHERGGVGRDALSRTALRRLRDARGSERGGVAVRGHGAGPTGRRHVLPLSNIAKPGAGGAPGDASWATLGDALTSRATRT